TNQGFVATLTAAAILARGEQGMQEACARGRTNATTAARALLRVPGVRLAFPDTPFWNAFVLALPCSSAAMIETARQRGIHLALRVSSAIPWRAGTHMILSFSDLQGPEPLPRLKYMFVETLGAPAPAGVPDPATTVTLPEVPAAYLRREPVGLPSWDGAQLRT